MKKIATIWVTAFLVAGLATSAFAFGPGWGERGRYNHSRGYAHGWQDDGRGRHGHDNGHEQGRRVYDQHSGYHTSSYGPGANVALPLVPLPGFSLWLPGISISIH